MYKKSEEVMESPSEDLVMTVLPNNIINSGNPSTRRMKKPRTRSKMGEWCRQKNPN
jgi:hypothetical protein